MRINKFYNSGYFKEETELNTVYQMMTEEGQKAHRENKLGLVGISLVIQCAVNRSLFAEAVIDGKEKKK